MRTSISIFVAGSKSLKEHRMQLKVLANDMNGEYRKRGEDVSINMYSYLNLGDSQSEYDDFIQHKADIVLFVIENSIGDKTENEFLLATERFQKHGIPKIFVFLKEFKERTPQLEHVEQLVSEHSNTYYIEYSNMEDLTAKVKARLQQEVAERIELLRPSPVKKVRRYRVWAIAATLALLALIGVVVTHWALKKPQPILVFVGGRSAVNYVRNNFDRIGDLHSYDNSIYIEMPSRTAWSIIAMEVMSHHAVDGGDSHMPFYPICISAKDATEADFLNLCSEQMFVGNGAVLSMFLGEDRLRIYIKKTLQCELVDGRDSISVSDLVALVHWAEERDVRIFSTQEGSGTLLSYQKILNPLGVYISKKDLGDNLDWFNEATPRNKIRRDEQPYIIMGSDTYVAREVMDDGDCRGLMVVDEQGEAIKKPIYMYFAGYNYDNGNSYWIPDEMVAFLESVDSRFGEIIKDNRLPRLNEKVLIPVEEMMGASQNAQ